MSIQKRKSVCDIRIVSYYKLQSCYKDLAPSPYSSLGSGREAVFNGINDRVNRLGPISDIIYRVKAPDYSTILSYISYWVNIEEKSPAALRAEFRY